MLLRVMENLAAISAWRDSLAEERGRQFNHPGACFWAWRRSTPSSAPTPARRDAAVSLDLTQDQIARASAAIYGLLKVGNTDTLVLARAALMAATRMPSKRIDDRECEDTVETRFAM